MVERGPSEGLRDVSNEVTESPWLRVRHLESYSGTGWVKAGGYLNSLFAWQHSIRGA